MEIYTKKGSENSLVRMGIKLSAFESLRNSNRSVYQHPVSVGYMIKETLRGFLQITLFVALQEGRPFVQMRNGWLLNTARVLNAQLDTN